MSTAWGPKAESVTEDGTSDGWQPTPGFVVDVASGGRTQLVVSVPSAWLGRVHQALVGALSPPLGVLYRQVVDRRQPRPEGAPPRDWVSLDQPPERVIAALADHTGLVHHDARCELWIKGALGDQVILDPDGLLFCQPDDPAFRDVLLGEGLSEGEFPTIADRDYVKHWFRAEADPLEDGLRAALGMVEVAPR